ncbi:hypothetical protein SO802_002193 [Lithocarpus litseifolius]|uniref:Neprosin PEP catalytic domain-containing protein n=1 Tax=Lithocarpus litseifolius TaxID=425828 RepID=A0AAW2DY82_9ROSI
MGKRITLIFLFVITFLVLSSVDVKTKAIQNLSEVDRKLMVLNKPAIKSIKSEDGDIIDCVDIYKQPAFGHPALRNHIIQMEPSNSFPFDTTISVKNESSLQVLSQTRHKSGSCPKGTIPIRRISRQELLRATSLEHFGREGPRTSSIVNSTNDKSSGNNGSKIQVFPPPNHTAAYLFTEGYGFVGARGVINVWNPRVDSPDEYTTAQIWIKNGPNDGFESIEAGWMLPENGGLVYGEDEVIGYWPYEIFNHLQRKARIVQWGGDVYSKNIKGVKPHTSTAMGSGNYAYGLWGSACYVDRLRIVDYNLLMKYPIWARSNAEEPNCYTALNYQESLAIEPVIYCGGPGQGLYGP